MKNIIEINNLSLIYGKGIQQKKALKNINFSLSKGEICGFLGPNGAGKTTLIKIMLGLLKPDTGNVLLFAKKTTDALNRQSIGYMPENKGNTISKKFIYFCPKVLNHRSLTDKNRNCSGNKKSRHQAK